MTPFSIARRVPLPVANVNHHWDKVQLSTNSTWQTPQNRSNSSVHVATLLVRHNDKGTYSNTGNSD